MKNKIRQMLFLAGTLGLFFLVPLLALQIAIVLILLRVIIRVFYGPRAEQYYAIMAANRITTEDSGAGSASGMRVGETIIIQ